MKFLELPLKGAYLIDLEKKEDERGFFARFYCENEYKDLNLDSQVVQINNSFNKYKGTMRGIHYQLPPKAETKVVRCIKGSLWDVILDLRKESPTFGKWYGEILSADNRRMMYVPKGFGHAFITLEEIEKIMDHIIEQPKPDEIKLPEITKNSQESDFVLNDNQDELLKDAAKLVVDYQQASVSLLQRKFRIGYSRAGRIIDELESLGIISEYNGSKAREVLFTHNQLTDLFSD